MKLGVFTVGLPDLTPEEAVMELRDAGYDGVEWRVTRVPEEARSEEPSFWGNNLCTLAPTEEEARRARRISEEADLEVPGLGTYVPVGDLEAAHEAMRFAVTAGAPQVRVGAGAPDGRSYGELFAAAKGVSGRGPGSRQVPRGQGSHRDPPQDHLPERLARTQACLGLRPRSGRCDPRPRKHGPGRLRGLPHRG